MMHYVWAKQKDSARRVEKWQSRDHKNGAQVRLEQRKKKRELAARIYKKR